MRCSFYVNIPGTLPQSIQDMTSINVAEDDRLVCHHKPDCFIRSNSLAKCTCDDAPLFFDSAEHSPLISCQNYSEGTDAKYLTDIHCHEAKPIHSNARAKRKLVVASVVCLLFVIAEVIGKYFIFKLSETC